MSQLTAEPNIHWPLGRGVQFRDPDILMTPEGLSALKPSRLSFTRSLVRRMARERWSIQRVQSNLDELGRGTVIYRISAGQHVMHFVVFSDQIPEEEKTERIIAKKWDGTAFLCEGPLTEEWLERTKGEITNVMLGRGDTDTIGWTRTNRSSRFFNHVVDELANGRQPDLGLLGQGGYLLRNSGFFGNGRHGNRLFSTLPMDHPLSRPYHAEMLALYMWRHFGFELAEYIARARSERAVALAPEIKRYIGIGNSSGVGLIPFVVRHPTWVQAWCYAREYVLDKAKQRHVTPDDPEITRLLTLLRRAAAFFRQHPSQPNPYFTPSETLASDLEQIEQTVLQFQQDGSLPEGFSDRSPWNALCDWATAALDRESAEVLNSLLMEVYPEIADEWDEYRYFAESVDVRPEETVGQLKAALSQDYSWALGLSTDAPEDSRYFWYLSEEHREPRVGVRGEEPGEQFEQFVTVLQAVKSLAADLGACSDELSVAEFLLLHPHHRRTVERVQSLRGLRYSEVRGNLISETFVPLHLIRFVLSTLGMERFDPRSTRWVQGTLLQGAPLAEDVRNGIEGDWIYPLKPNLEGYS